MAEYYIDYVGGADTNNGTGTATPFQHCPGDNNATDTADATTLTSDDIVVFKGGVTYTGRIDCDWSGTSGHVITYISGHLHTTPWGTGAAIVDGVGASLNEVGSENGLFSIHDKAYITIKGITISNCPTLGAGHGYGGGVSIYCISGGNITVDQCNIIDGFENGIVIYGLWNVAAHASGFTITDNTISGNEWHGILAYCGMDTVLIQGNTIHENGTHEGNGIFTSAGGTDLISGLTIRGNTIYDPSVTGAKGHMNIGAHDVLIEDNYCYNTGVVTQGFGIAIATDLGLTTVDNVIIRNNVVDVNSIYEGAIRIQHNNSAIATMTGVLIYNNYLRQRGIGAGVGMPVIWARKGVSGADPCISNLVIKNNVLHAATTKNDERCIYIVDDTCKDGFDSQNNHYYMETATVPCYWGSDGDRTFAQWVVLGFDTFVHTQDADPQVDANFVPVAGSPLIDTGIDLSVTGFSDDKNGNSRPFGSAWDIGPFEYGSGANPYVMVY